MLEERINYRQAVVGVIGMGYVGLPLALGFISAGFRVTGLETDDNKVSALNSGKSYVKDVSDAELKEALATGCFSAAADSSILAQADAVIICVPTPLSKTKEPDLRYIESATAEIKKYLHPGMLIVLESTTFPGTTDELILSELEETGLKAGQDFFLCFSPERVDPGNSQFNTANTPKVIGGVTPRCGELAEALYGSFVSNVVRVSSTRVAEMVKLLENTFRSINIGMVNELALMCDRMGIDIWEVIEAAATKPFGFMKFQPGPGIGGHCIPLDPAYLSWKAKSYDFHTKFIALAMDINENMPRYTVSKIADALNLHKKCLNGARILLLGMAYKKDINDPRESPSQAVYYLLKEKGALVEYNDPFVPEVLLAGKIIASVPLDGLRHYDCVLLCTAHSCYDYAGIAAEADLIVDTRNAFAGIRNNGHIVKIGAALPEGYARAQVME
ncbi:MAG: nucleotide sugar dehydrogenase [bacterium]|nr:nucleotide sugar dehydrogenase [bacterium]